MPDFLTPEQISYVPNFSGCNIEDDISAPLEGANCNVVFPRCWNYWRRAIWRRDNDCPGAGWNYERGFHTIGVPTIASSIAAKFLNFLHRGPRCR